MRTHSAALTAVATGRGWCSVLLALAAVVITQPVHGAESDRTGAAVDPRRENLVVDVRLGERNVLFVAPDNEATRQWGVYGCPDMFRAADGSITVYDGGEMDTYDRQGAARAPAVCLRSTDDGRTWQPWSLQGGDDPPTPSHLGYGTAGKVFQLADGGQVQFVPKGPPADLAALGVAARGLFMTPNEYGLLGLFRPADIPVEARAFRVRHRARPDAAWHWADGVFDVPDWQIGAVVKAKTGVATWPDVAPTFAPLACTSSGLHQGATGETALVEATDGAWLSALVHMAPTDRNATYCCHLRCIASTDQGKTWRPRGAIIDRAGTRFGATEEFSMIRLGDEIVCVVRMDCATTTDPHRSTMLARSADDGLTWSVAEPVASSSVTPHLVKLDNDVVALVFGRPGVHVQFSTDGCRSWGSLTSLIGTTAEEELAAGHNLLDAMYGDPESYCNTRTVVTGPDRFLVLFSDFRHGGDRRKAIVVQEIAVVPRPKEKGAGHQK